MNFFSVHNKKFPFLQRDKSKNNETRAKVMRQDQILSQNKEYYRVAGNP